MRGRIMLAAGALVMATWVVALPAGAALRANSQTYNDSTGEDGAAPDITTVVVSNDDSGLITFRINIANRPQLTSDMAVVVFLDTDLNAGNGAGSDLGGAELVIDLSGGTVDLARWNGSMWDYSSGSPASLTYSYANGATFQIAAGHLGGITAFNFFVGASSGTDADMHLDTAPDPGHGMFNYQVKLAPPTVTPPAAKPQLKLSIGAVTVVPKRPKAGSTVNASAIVLRSDTGKQIRTGKVSCKASIGGKALAPAKAGFVKGRANCNWLIPKGARGKTVTASITVTFEGAKISRSFSVRVAA